MENIIKNKEVYQLEGTDVKIRIYFDLERNHLHFHLRPNFERLIPYEVDEIKNDNTRISITLKKMEDYHTQKESCSKAS